MCSKTALPPSPTTISIVIVSCVRLGGGLRCCRQALTEALTNSWTHPRHSVLRTTAAETAAEPKDAEWSSLDHSPYAFLPQSLAWSDSWALKGTGSHSYEVFWRSGFSTLNEPDYRLTNQIPVSKGKVVPSIKKLSTQWSILLKLTGSHPPIFFLGNPSKVHEFSRGG